MIKILFVCHEINEEYTETEYRVYTYDEDWDVEKFRPKR